MNIAMMDDCKDDINKASTLISSILINHNISNFHFFEYTSGYDLLSDIDKIVFDIILLDIYTNDLSGIEIAEKIRLKDSTVKIVFISSSNDFASESFTVNASYYLTKPINENKITSMIKRILLDDILYNKQITFPNGQAILIRSIMYSICNQHVISFYIKNGQIIDQRIRQYILEDVLNQYKNFVVSSKGIIVNLEYVKEITEHGLLMINNTTLPISRRKRKDVLNEFNIFLLNKLKRT